MVEEAIIVVAIGSFEIIFSCDREIAFFFSWYSASVINLIICSLLCVTNEKCLESCCLSLNFVAITEKSEMVMIFWYVVYIIM